MYQIVNISVFKAGEDGWSSVITMQHTEGDVKQSKQEIITWKGVFTEEKELRLYLVRILSLPGEQT